jgi:hypothetical protein
MESTSITNASIYKEAKIEVHGHPESNSKIPKDCNIQTVTTYRLEKSVMEK